ncbi:MAG: GHMP family kinase ATP-binding protein [Nitrospiria bacterium]
MKRVLRVPGSCGELAQGRIDGVRLHITCPVNRYTWGVIGSCQQVRHPVGDKVNRLLYLIDVLRRKSERQRGLASLFAKKRFTLYSELPVGKGMASSTADMTAALVLYQWMSGYSLKREEWVKLLLAVEPTDGIMFEGITLFDHYAGSFRISFGAPPPMEIIALEFEDTVDTVSFNQNDQKKTARLQTGTVLKSFHLIEEGIKEGSVQKIGEGATLSALSHQNIFRKPDLEKVLKLTLELGGVGVNIAHSGSMIGMLFNPGSVDFQMVKVKVKTLLGKSLPMRCLRLRGGGIEFLEPRQAVPV